MVNKDNKSIPEGDIDREDRQFRNPDNDGSLIEDEDNLYTLIDDDDGESRNTPEEEEYVDITNSEDQEGNEEESTGYGMSGWKLLIKIMSTPVEGWKALKRAQAKPESLASSIFYPMIALSSISEFSSLLYGVHLEVSAVLMKALSDFIAFFFGYFTVMAFSGIFFSKKISEALKTNFGKEFVMMNMVTLALFVTIFNLFPMIDAILVFLPLWTLYLVCKGVRFLRIDKEKETKVQIILCFMILGFPCLWYWLCSQLLPSI